MAVTHPPRMGKTSFMFAYVEASKTKKALMATVSNGIKVFVKEMKRLGITDYKVVKKLRDLNDPAKYHIASHAWLKTTGRKKPAGQNERLKEECLCPVCQSRLVRYEHEVIKDASGHIVLDERTGWPKMRQCRLVIANPDHPDDPHDVQVVPAKSHGYGWICANEECRPENAWPVIARIGIGAELFGPGGKQPPVDLKLHLRCIAADRSHFRRGSRQCSTCGYVHKAWMPARYKRIGKRYSTLCVDEIHNIKAGSTDVAYAIRGLVKAKRKVSASGTMMPTKPRDCFYPFSWTFGNNNYKFEFPHGSKGVREFNSEYTQTITMVSENNATYKKAVPYLKRPHQFAKWRSCRTMFRHYEDPEAQAALLKAGLIIPKLVARPVELVPDPKQGILLVASVAEFDQRFKQYAEELRQKTVDSEEGRAHLLNSAQIIARMQMMKYAASLPGLVNEKLVAKGLPSVYNGRYAGVKEEFILDKVSEKAELG
jgi:rubredoxin